MKIMFFLLACIVVILCTFHQVLASPAHQTFRTCNTTAVNHEYFENSKKNVSVAEQFKNTRQYHENNCNEILQMSSFPNTAKIQRNGFVHTVVDAYNGHHNLIIRPDDVWAAIMTQFSFYLNKNAEEFRNQFVNFEKKKKLVVQDVGTLRTVRYGNIVMAMTQEVDKNLVDLQLKKWVLPSFSTTTENDIVTVGVIFMATMKKYFNYGFELACGIPEITLEGTVEDWKNVYGRLEKLKEYKLQNWYNLLEPVLKQFVNARQGNVELDFWQRMVNDVPFGSASSEISGWITVFCAFDEEGNWKQLKGNGSWFIVDSDDIPRGIVEVDVEINEHGVIHNSVMFAGHMVTEIQTDGHTIQPTLGWVIALKRLNTSESISQIDRIGEAATSGDGGRCVHCVADFAILLTLHHFVFIVYSYLLV